MADRDFYDVLGVSRGASGDDIRKAYKKLSRKFHPDKNPADPEAANARFMKATRAYETIAVGKKKKPAPTSTAATTAKPKPRASAARSRASGSRRK